MVQTRFALILFFSMVAHKAACHAPTLLMALLVQQDVGGTLVLFTQNSNTEDLS